MSKKRTAPTTNPHKWQFITVNGNRYVRIPLYRKPFNWLRAWAK